jgi:hypothetical protein
MTVAAKKNLFETFSKDVQFGNVLTRSKSFKQERLIFSFLKSTKKKILYSSSFLPDKINSPPLRRRSQGKKQELKTEIDESSIETKPEVFDDDTSKLTFKEKMILFNKKKNLGSSTSSSLKANRNRLTQVFYSQTYIYMTNIPHNTLCGGERYDSRREEQMSIYIS